MHVAWQLVTTSHLSRAQHHTIFLWPTHDSAAYGCWLLCSPPGLLVVDVYRASPTPRLPLTRPSHPLAASRGCRSTLCACNPHGLPAFNFIDEADPHSLALRLCPRRWSSATSPAGLRHCVSFLASCLRLLPGGGCVRRFQGLHPDVTLSSNGLLPRTNLPLSAGAELVVRMRAPRASAENVPYGTLGLEPCFDISSPWWAPWAVRLGGPATQASFWPVIGDVVLFCTPWR